MRIYTELLSFPSHRRNVIASWHILIKQNSTERSSVLTIMIIVIWDVTPSPIQVHWAGVSVDSSTDFGTRMIVTSLPYEQPEIPGRLSSRAESIPAHPPSWGLLYVHIHPTLGLRIHGCVPPTPYSCSAYLSIKLTLPLHCITSETKRDNLKYTTSGSSNTSGCCR